MAERQDTEPSPAFFYLSLQVRFSFLAWLFFWMFLSFFLMKGIHSRYQWETSAVVPTDAELTCIIHIPVSYTHLLFKWCPSGFLQYTKPYRTQFWCKGTGVYNRWVRNRRPCKNTGNQGWKTIWTSIRKREKSKEPAGTIKVKKLDGWSSYYGGLVIWLV